LMVKSKKIVVLFAINGKNQNKMMEHEFFQKNQFSTKSI